MRNSFFWIFDFFRRKKIRNHFNEIKFIIENPNDSKSIEIKSKRLNKLINHSKSTTSFYKKIDSRENNISDFPVIDKNIILENFNSFCSSTYKNKKLKQVSTSGSTGIPFIVNHNTDKTNRNTADTIYFSSQGKYNLGDKLVYVKLWNEKNLKSKTTLLLQNIYPYNILNNSIEEIKRFLNDIKNMKGTKTMIIYPSFLEIVCKYLDEVEEVIDYNIKSIITISESLGDDLRKIAEQHFSCPTFERYSNMENGILAQQTWDSSGNYKINNASYHIEILKLKSNELAKKGEIGRIVVTDLYNYAMPMIRYDTGDLGVLNTHDYPVFTKLYGRKMDVVYSTDKNIISPHIFYKISAFSEHKQFQFIQNGEKEYCFRLNSTKEKTNEEGLTTYFKKFLGQDAEFIFEYVNEIPLLASGKRKKVVNNYTK